MIIEFPHQLALLDTRLDPVHINRELGKTEIKQHEVSK